MKKKFNDSYIVFCNEHYNPLGIVRSLGEKRIYPFVIIVGDGFKIVSASRYVGVIKNVKTIEEGYLFLLDNFAKDGKKRFVFTSDDNVTSYLDFHYDEFSQHFIFFNAGQSGRINKYMQKIEVQKLAEECGFLIPKTSFIKNGAKVPDGLKYPIITKAISSISGGWKKDVFICNSSEDIEANYKNIKSETISLQEYIKKDNELCLDGFSYDHGKSVFIAIASTYDYLIDKTYSPYMTVESFKESIYHNKVKSKLEKMFSIIGFEGIFSVEFIIKGNELIFLEINFRNSTWSYASTIMGLNLPYLWSQEMVLNGDIDKLELLNSDVKKFKAMDEITDFKYRVSGKKMNLLKWLRQFLSCKCKYLLGRRDPAPFFSRLFKKHNL